MAEKGEKRLWFGGKDSKYSWVPTSWQGWASLGVWGVVVTLSIVWLSNQNDYPQATYNLLYILMVFISTAVLVILSKIKS